MKCVPELAQPAMGVINRTSRVPSQSRLGDATGAAHCARLADTLNLVDQSERWYFVSWLYRMITQREEERFRC